jgi:hypothetical protein
VAHRWIFDLANDDVYIATFAVAFFDVKWVLVSRPGSNVAASPTNTVHSANRALMVASMASLAETRDSTIDQVYLVNYKVANSGSSTFIVGEIIELVQCCSLRTKQEVLIFSGLCLSQMSRPCKAAAARVSALIACAVMLFRCRPET